MASYECPKHKTTQDGWCEQCVQEYKNRRPVTEMSAEERAAELESISPILTIPFGDLHNRIEELAGRGVWTHELGKRDILQRLAKDVRDAR
jgi:hypothetical protein